jgi:hypothetical protein
MDVIAAGTVITPERAPRRFLGAHFHVREGLLINPGNPHALHCRRCWGHFKILWFCALVLTYSGRISHNQ